MEPEDLVLALDLGTSHAKAAAVTSRGDVVARASSPLRVHLKGGGGAEQDPHEWWSAVSEASRHVVEELDDAARVLAVCATGQWACTVPVDETGTPLHDALIWLDSRGREAVGHLTRGLPSIAGYSAYRLYHWVRLTAGAPTHSGKDSLAHVLYLRERDPELYRRTFKFLEAKDYLNLVMTGRFRSGPDAQALLWATDNRDLSRVDYHPRLLGWAGLDREKLPDLGRSCEVLGPLLPGPAEELGLEPEVPVVVGTPDLHAGALGAGASRDLEAHLSLGTSSWISCHVPFKRTDVRHALVSLPSANPERYLVIAEQEVAGAALRHLAEQLLFPEGGVAGPPPEDVYARLDAAAAAVPPGADGLVFLPWLYGERAPVEDSSLRGGFHNLSLGHTQAHLARAVLEGVACNSRWLLGPVERFVGHRFPELRVIGGGARSALWCQILADVLDRPILQVEDPGDACLRGAAFLAWVALGEASFEDLAARAPVAARFEPEPTRRVAYDRLFRAFVESHAALAPLHRRWNDADP